MHPNIEERRLGLAVQDLGDTLVTLGMLLTQGNRDDNQAAFGNAAAGLERVARKLRNDPPEGETKRETAMIEAAVDTKTKALLIALEKVLYSPIFAENPHGAISAWIVQHKI